MGWFMTYLRSTKILISECGGKNIFLTTSERCKFGLFNTHTANFWAKSVFSAKGAFLLSHNSSYYCTNMCIGSSKVRVQIAMVGMVLQE